MSEHTPQREHEHECYNRRNYPIFICRHGNWDIYANARGACASIPIEHPSAKGCKASHFGDVAYVKQTLRVDADVILRRALEGGAVDSHETAERHLLLCAIDAAFLELSEAGGCDHSVNICWCGTETMLENLDFDARYGDRLKRKACAKALIDELGCAADCYDDDEERKVSLRGLIASLKGILA